MNSHAMLMLEPFEEFSIDCFHRRWLRVTLLSRLMKPNNFHMIFSIIPKIFTSITEDMPHLSC
jgi:hypothetical protein